MLEGLQLLLCISHKFDNGLHVHFRNPQSNTFSVFFFANCLLFLWIFDEKKWFSALETGNFLYKVSRHCTLTHIISTPIGKMKFVHSGNKIT